MNKVILIGRLGQDPEQRVTKGGDPVTSLSIATSDRWTKDGQQQERTEWHRVVAFGKPAEILGKYGKKGSQVMVEGTLRTREYEQDGVRKWSTEVVLERFGSSFELLGSKGEEPKQRQAEPELDYDSDIPF